MQNLPTGHIKESENREKKRYDDRWHGNQMCPIFDEVTTKTEDHERKQWEKRD